MQLRDRLTGELLTLETAAPLGRGGEAQVYPIQSRPDQVAKIYAPGKATTERARKLVVMLANPPEVPTSGGEHVPLAWPTGLLTQPHDPNAVVGFLMPRAYRVEQMIDYYNPQRRLEFCPLFDYRYLLRAARNLAATTRSIHARGYVIGDLKHSNVLVSQTALVTLVDADSFQVVDPQTGTLYPCRVGTPDYTPPERQHDIDSQAALTPAHDLFALAVLIFQLLMEGTHPFAGVYTGEGDPPAFEERIAAGHFPYGSSPGPYRPGKRTAPPFEMLPPPLQKLFLQCFEAGHADPSARPTAQTWQTELDAACNTLKLCADNPHHFYSDHLDACPWCLRRDTQLRGLDPFPCAPPAPTVTEQRTQPVIPVPPAPKAVPVPPATSGPPLNSPGNGLLFGWIGLLVAAVFGIALIAGQFQPTDMNNIHAESNLAYNNTVNSSISTPASDPRLIGPFVSWDNKYTALYIADAHGIEIRTEDLGNRVGWIPVKPETFHGMRFSDDSQSLLVNQADGSQRIWNIHKAKFD